VAWLVGYRQRPHLARAFRPTLRRLTLGLSGRDRLAYCCGLAHLARGPHRPRLSAGQAPRGRAGTSARRARPERSRLRACDQHLRRQGHDLIGVLAEHPRRADVTARLVELDEHNALLARRTAEGAGLDGVEVVVADASMTDAYEGAVPADLVLLCGVFGNISAEDIANTVSHLPRLCAPEATVIWTRHRHTPDLTPYIRETFERAGFGEVAFEGSPPFGVGANRLLGPPLPFTSGVRLFEFVGYDVLQPDFHASQGGA
jgi:hypothetical protein